MHAPISIRCPYCSSFDVRGWKSGGWAVPRRMPGKPMRRTTTRRQRGLRASQRCSFLARSWSLLDLSTQLRSSRPVKAGPAIQLHPAHRRHRRVARLGRRQIGRATSELQSPVHLVCRLLLEKKKKKQILNLSIKKKKKKKNKN